MPEISEEQLQHLARLTHADPHTALKLLRQFADTHNEERRFRMNLPTFLIDIGSMLANRDIVDEGITAAHSIFADTSEELRAHLEYNLANGYSALDAIDRHKSDFQFQPHSTPLVLAKKH